MDVKQIKANRKMMEESTIQSPIVPTIEDTDADYGERLYDQLPKDALGHLPPGTEE